MLTIKEKLTKKDQIIEALSNFKYKTAVNISKTTKLESNKKLVTSYLNTAKLEADDTPYINLAAIIIHANKILKFNDVNYLNNSQIIEIIDSIVMYFNDKTLSLENFNNLPPQINSKEYVNMLYTSKYFNSSLFNLLRSHINALNYDFFIFNSSDINTEIIKFKNPEKINLLYDKIKVDVIYDSYYKPSNPTELFNCIVPLISDDVQKVNLSSVCSSNLHVIYLRVSHKQNGSSYINNPYNVNINLRINKAPTDNCQLLSLGGFNSFLNYINFFFKNNLEILLSKSGYSSDEIIIFKKIIKKKIINKLFLIKKQILVDINDSIIPAFNVFINENDLKIVMKNSYKSTNGSNMNIIIFKQNI